MIKAFAYKSPRTLDQALSSLGTEWGKVDVLAGGTDLLNLMKEGLASPETVVNIKGIEDLGGIQVGDDGVRIGAIVTLADVEAHAAIAKHLPALAEAVRVLGGPQIRNMGTLGGSLCQRRRDWYFRNGLDPREKLETQYSAIFPMDGAIYVHPSTTAPPLLAYGATVHVAGPSSRVRQIPIEEFFQVSKGEKRETVLAADEIVTSVMVPVESGLQSADYEVRERDSHDWPLVQASVVLKVSGGKVDRARVALGHVAPIPLRSKAAEEAIAGQEVNLETAAAAGKAAVQDAKPLGKNGYKVTLAEVAVKRALLAAVGNAYWRNEA